MVEKSTKEIFDLKSDRILAVGIGKMGRLFLDEYYGKREIVLFDNDKKKQSDGIEYNGECLKVHPLSDLLLYDKGDVSIVISSIYYSELYKQVVKIVAQDIPIFVYPFIESRQKLMENQIKKCIYEYYYFNNYDPKESEQLCAEKLKNISENEKFVIPYLPIEITSKCTLNCENCNNLMPHLRDASKLVDFSSEKIKESIDNISNAVDEIIFCELVGGEPFLYKKLPELIEYLGNNEKVSQIIMITNATVVPSEEVCKLLKKYNVIVKISDYGYFDKMSKFVGELDKYDIKVRVDNNMHWINSGGIEKRDRSENERFIQYNKCVMSMRCRYLIEDKLFTCARIGSLSMLGISDEENDVLNIQKGIDKETIYDFYMNDNSLGCDYCDMCAVDGGEKIPAAIQVGRISHKHSNYTIISNKELEILRKNRG